MKALIFISSLSLKCGGPSRSVPMLVKGLGEVGVDVTLMTQRTNDMNTHALDGTTAKLHILESGWSVRDLEEFVLSEKFDLIQIQNLWESCYHKLAKVAQKHHIPYIITPRGTLEPWSLSQKKWKKKLALLMYQMKDLNRSACIFTTADMEAKHVRELGVKVPISVIPNGIEPNGYPCRKSVDAVKKQILFLSRIHIKKGVELLIEAWNRLYNQYPDWNVVVVGNGEAGYIEKLRDIVKRKGLASRFEIKEPVFGDAKIKFYQESSLFCLPSYSENFGMVIAEAMSCGVPVITTTNCPWEILNETKTGWCIHLNVYNLESSLREAMSQDSVTLYNMGQKASRIVYENYNYVSVAKKTKRLYDWILNGGDKPVFVYE